MSSDKVNDIKNEEGNEEYSNDVIETNPEEASTRQIEKKCLNKKKLRRMLKMKKLNQKQNRGNNQGVLKLLNWLNAMIVGVK